MVSCHGVRRCMRYSFARNDADSVCTHNMFSLRFTACVLMTLCCSVVSYSSFITSRLINYGQSVKGQGHRASLNPNSVKATKCN